ncbi:hypothetical protein GCK32_011612 [Trichostrongylus colubriformis]|uniref:Uncharacterized protein n=1 Tax=Trichostrongylus colubriformis TaxID=6319 RepID=A0AAN8FFK6_TRICO
MAGKLSLLLEEYEKEVATESQVPQEEAEQRIQKRESRLHKQCQKKRLEVPEKNLNKAPIGKQCGIANLQLWDTSGKATESTSAAKRTRENGGTPSSSSYDLWKGFCKRGTEVFRGIQKKIAALERQEARTWDNHLQKIDIRMKNIEKSLADHHEFFRQTAGPTNLVIKPEHVDELLKRVMTSSIEMQSNLEEQMDSAKNWTKCPKREVSSRLAAFQTEVTQRFEALEKKRDPMLDVTSILRRIDSQLKKSDDGDAGSGNEDARKQGIEESI